MNSKYIKYALLKYFRFTRQMIVATEVNVCGGIADILAINEIRTKSIEVEIKISKADFKREFKDKRYKHWNNTDIRKPNYYYFAFPHELAEELKSSVPSQYGIISIFNHNEVKIIQQGTKLNHNTDNKILFDRIIKRNSSELIKYYGRYEIDN